MKISPTRTVAVLAIGSLGVFCTRPALADPVLLDPGSTLAGGSAGTAVTFSEFLSVSPPTAVATGSDGFAFVDSGLLSPQTSLSGIALENLPASGLGELNLTASTGGLGSSSFRQTGRPNHQIVAEVWPSPDLPATPETVFVPLPPAIWGGLALLSLIIGPKVTQIRRHA